MNNKQTAIEYLEKAIDKYVAYIEGNPDAKIFTSSNLYLTVEQAKEIFKEQIIESHIHGHNAPSSTIKNFDAEQYYNEEYNK